jgi:hypothetical protein
VGSLLLPGRAFLIPAATTCPSWATPAPMPGTRRSFGRGRPQMRKSHLRPSATPAQSVLSQRPSRVGCGLDRAERRRCYRLARSGNTITQTTLSPKAAIDFEKSHMRATAPGFRAGTTIVSPLTHFLISSDALASLSRNPADAGRQYCDVGRAALGAGGVGGSGVWALAALEAIKVANIKARRFIACFPRQIPRQSLSRAFSARKPEPFPFS